MWDSTSLWRARWFSHIKVQFKPNDGFLNSIGCCCCEKIGFVQIVKQQINYVQILSAVPYPSHDWKVDDGICGVPYSANSVMAPCHWHPKSGRPSVRGVADLEDTPNVQFPLFAGYLTHFSQDFEACVMCVSQDNPHVVDEGLLAPAGVIAGAVSYGCLKWGHKWTIVDESRRVWNWHRYAGDNSWNGLTTGSGGTVPGEFTGYATAATAQPSPEFRKTLLGYSVSLSGCWGSAVYGI